ncbi:Na+/H+ antiporter NhaC family protein [Mucilaginibacter sp. BT774]|uniref:Na+/H+ antiporter NhaC family protein n=1 Tax=Mucilaginibacter sp. BT774 TaxID=3062276 RepID=UPI0026765271|nr:Na+/H+ antiporter NhaC family protein [Mucilaginibacter sp. BT774]MDO3628970.1 Na+/H+ antiporter NhaC family protein [Mucilaginibacter sp. BT774]
MGYGAIALIPPAVVIILAIKQRTSFEPLLIGCLVGYAIIGYHEHTNVFTIFVNSFEGVMGKQDSVWVILVCGLYGSLIGLMVRSGGTFKFGEWALKRLKTEKSALMGAWGLGLFIFLDDYLSALTVGLSMRKITDAFKVPREKLAYIVNTTAPPWCVIVPISTWTIFISNILETSKVAQKGQGLSTYWKMIPYVAYGYISVLIIPLFIYGIFPWFGRIKKADIRAKETGQLTATEFSDTASLDISAMNPAKSPRVIYFLLPIIVLLAATIYFDIDALKGVMVAVVFTFVYYLIIKLGSFKQLSETVFGGFNSMVFALAILMMSYVLKDVNDKMGLTQYILHSASPYLNKEFLPVIVFVSLSLISVTTGSSWGLYAIAIPLVVPLAQHFNSNVLLNCGAVISAGVFGANACLYSDATVLTAQSTECNNLDHGLSQLPYAFIAFIISSMVYVILGYIIH